MHVCRERKIKDKPDCDERFFTRSRGGVDATERFKKMTIGKKKEEMKEDKAFRILNREREK